MSDYQIGLSGMRVAQQALDVIGTNLANAATAGYHRQEIRIEPVEINHHGRVAIGGAQIALVRRAMDVLLEAEVLRQRQPLGQVSQELMALESLQSALGDLNGSGVGGALTAFFGALQELSAQPESVALREQAVRAADTLASHFNNLGQFMADLTQHVRTEGENLVSQINALTEEIALLNDQIQGLSVRQGNPNLLMDRRDQAIASLAELTEVQVEQVPGGLGVVNVIAWGTPLVIGNKATPLELSLTEGNRLGVSVTGANFYSSDLSGGRLGGVLSIHNDILSGLQQRLDGLAAEVVRQINALHVEGVGLNGSFTSLTGWAVSTETFSQWDQWGESLSAGDIRVRVTDVAAGTATVHSVSVAADDTIADVAARLEAIDGLSASVAGGVLTIEAEDEDLYRFDFLPVAALETQVGWSGTSAVSLSGISTSADGVAWTCTVVGGGAVGLTDGLTVEVRNVAGELVRRLTVGSGYAAGDVLDVADGLTLSFGVGTLSVGETFTVEAAPESDSSGLLAAAGINTFFRGDSMLSIEVDRNLLNDPDRLACALDATAVGNANALRMAAVGETPLAPLDGATPSEAFRLAVTDVGQRIAFGQARRDSLEGILQQLSNQQDQVSGVDVNAEAGKMLMFETMFQALARLVRTQSNMMQNLMDVL